MNDELRKSYKTATRYDLVKFRWWNIDVLWTSHVRDTVDAAWQALQDEYPNISLKRPKYTVLPASPNKPNGIFLLELFGFAAEAVRKLPVGWMQYLTYAHVKSFARGMTIEGIKDINFQMINTVGRRQAVLTQGGSAGSSKKGKRMPALRLGSRKSDLHFVVYAREGQAPGFESRWRDEGLADRCLKVHDILEERQIEDWSLGWDWLRLLLSRDASDALFTEMASRGIDLERYVESWSSSPAPIAQQQLLGIDDDEMPVDYTPGDTY